LVIEDDPDIRDLLHEVLRDEGYELLFVDNVDREVANAAPDLVITNLAGLHRGYDGGLARASVRRVQERYPAIPIIVCTAKEEALKEPDRLGAAAVLRRPFAIETLIQTVTDLVSR
jgi:two-component system nitrogen regulation response regulator NtrX